ncbi:MAG: hypothetical protein WCV85_01265 [Patescibacteria group bacterium]|jgi:hypothetical protein
MAHHNEHVTEFVQAIQKARSPDETILLENVKAILKQFLQKDIPRNEQLVLVHTAAQFIPVQVVFAEMLKCAAILDRDIEQFFFHTFLVEVEDADQIAYAMVELFTHRRGALEILYMKICKLSLCQDVFDLLACPTQVPS